MAVSIVIWRSEDERRQRLVRTSASRPSPARSASTSRSGGSCPRGSGSGSRRSAPGSRWPRRAPAGRPAAAAPGRRSPSSTSESCVRICALLVRREDVDDAVDRLRRRVGVQRARTSGGPSRRSGAPTSTVSRSRISPMSTMSGSSRSAARRAAPKRLRVAVHLALVDQAALVLVDVLDRVLDREDVVVALGLILSSIAASVVDLPLPVGPVTRTRPRGRLGELGDAPAAAPARSKRRGSSRG